MFVDVVGIIKKIDYDLSAIKTKNNLFKREILIENCSQDSVSKHIISRFMLNITRMKQIYD